MNDISRIDDYLLRHNGVYKRKKKPPKMFNCPQLKGVVLKVLECSIFFKYQFLVDFFFFRLLSRNLENQTVPIGNAAKFG